MSSEESIHHNNYGKEISLPLLIVINTNQERWASIIGISKYKNTNLNLRYADRDAEELYQLLLTPSGGGGLEQDHIKKLTNGSPDSDRPENVYLLTFDTDP